MMADDRNTHCVDLRATFGHEYRVLFESTYHVEKPEFRAVQAAQGDRTVAVGWSAADCKTPPETTRGHFGSDGVLVPMVTDDEKRSRRQKIRQKQRQRGKKAKPLAPAKSGADQSYKEFKIVTYYDATTSRTLTAQEWAGEMVHAYKHEGYDAVWQRLVPRRTALRCPFAATTARTAGWCGTPCGSTTTKAARPSSVSAKYFATSWKTL